jgi:hypothetical protein
LAYDTARDLAELPIQGRAMRYCLWLVFCCPWGGRFTRAIIPFDDCPDTSCDQVASMLDFPNEPEDIAIVIHQRDTAATQVDGEFFGLFQSAVSRYDTVPWVFYAAGPDGTTLLGTSAPN